MQLWNVKKRVLLTPSFYENKFAEFTKGGRWRKTATAPQRLMAQKDGYINITGAEGKKKIEYITSEKHMENYEDPEEKVRAEFFAELIYKDYNIKPEQPQASFIAIR